MKRSGPDMPPQPKSRIPKLPVETHAVTIASFYGILYSFDTENKWQSLIQDYTRINFVENKSDTDSPYKILAVVSRERELLNYTISSSTKSSVKGNFVKWNDEKLVHGARFAKPEIAQQFCDQLSALVTDLVNIDKLKESSVTINIILANDESRQFTVDKNLAIHQLLDKVCGDENLNQNLYAIHYNTAANSPVPISCKMADVENTHLKLVEKRALMKSLSLDTRKIVSEKRDSKKPGTTAQRQGKPERPRSPSKADRDFILNATDPLVMNFLDIANIHPYELKKPRVHTIVEDFIAEKGGVVYLKKIRDTKLSRPVLDEVGEISQRVTALCESPTKTERTFNRIASVQEKTVTEKNFDLRRAYSLGTVSPTHEMNKERESSTNAPKKKRKAPLPPGPTGRLVHAASMTSVNSKDEIDGLEKAVIEKNTVKEKKRKAPLPPGANPTADKSISPTPSAFSNGSSIGSAIDSSPPSTPYSETDAPESQDAADSFQRVSPSSDQLESGVKTPPALLLPPPPNEPPPVEIYSPVGPLSATTPSQAKGPSYMNELVKSLEVRKSLKLDSSADQDNPANDISTKDDRESKSDIISQKINSSVHQEVGTKEDEKQIMIEKEATATVSNRKKTDKPTSAAKTGAGYTVQLLENQMRTILHSLELLSDVQDETQKELLVKPLLLQQTILQRMIDKEKETSAGYDARDGNDNAMSKPANGKNTSKSRSLDKNVVLQGSRKVSNEIVRESHQKTKTGADSPPEVLRHEEIEIDIDIESDESTPTFSTFETEEGVLLAEEENTFQQNQKRDFDEAENPNVDNEKKGDLIRKQEELLKKEEAEELREMQEKKMRLQIEIERRKKEEEETRRQIEEARKRLEEEKQKKFEEEEKRRIAKEEKAKVEEEEKKRKEEAERKRKDEAEKRRKDEEERARVEEAEKKRREEEEKKSIVEHQKRMKREEEQKRMEEEERKRKNEELKQIEVESLKKQEEFFELQKLRKELEIQKEKENERLKKERQEIEDLRRELQAQRELIGKGANVQTGLKESDSGRGERTLQTVEVESRSDRDEKVTNFGDDQTALLKNTPVTPNAPEGVYKVKEDPVLNPGKDSGNVFKIQSNFNVDPQGKEKDESTSITQSDSNATVGSTQGKPRVLPKRPSANLVSSAKRSSDSEATKKPLLGLYAKIQQIANERSGTSETSSTNQKTSPPPKDGSIVNSAAKVQQDNIGLSEMGNSKNDIEGTRKISNENIALGNEGTTIQDVNRPAVSSGQQSGESEPTSSAVQKGKEFVNVITTDSSAIVEGSEQIAAASAVKEQKSIKLEDVPKQDEAGAVKEAPRQSNISAPFTFKPQVFRPTSSFMSKMAELQGSSKVNSAAGEVPSSQANGEGKGFDVTASSQDSRKGSDSSIMEASKELPPGKVNGLLTDVTKNEPESKLVPGALDTMMAKSENAVDIGNSVSNDTIDFSFQTGLGDYRPKCISPDDLRSSSPSKPLADSSNKPTSASILRNTVSKKVPPKTLPKSGPRTLPKPKSNNVNFVESAKRESVKEKIQGFNRPASVHAPDKKIEVLNLAAIPNRRTEITSGSISSSIMNKDIKHEERKERSNSKSGEKTRMLPVVRSNSSELERKISLDGSGPSSQSELAELVASEPVQPPSLLRRISQNSAMIEAAKPIAFSGIDSKGMGGSLPDTEFEYGSTDQNSNNEPVKLGNYASIREVNKNENSDRDTVTVKKVGGLKIGFGRDKPKVYNV